MGGEIVAARKGTAGEIRRPFELYVGAARRPLGGFRCPPPWPPLPRGRRSLACFRGRRARRPGPLPRDRSCGGGVGGASLRPLTRLVARLRALGRGRLTVPRRPRERPGTRPGHPRLVRPAAPAARTGRYGWSCRGAPPAPAAGSDRRRRRRRSRRRCGRSTERQSADERSRVGGGAHGARLSWPRPRSGRDALAVGARAPAARTDAPGTAAGAVAALGPRSAGARAGRPACRRRRGGGARRRRCRRPAGRASPGATAVSGRRRIDIVAAAGRAATVVAVAQRLSSPITTRVAPVAGGAGPGRRSPRSLPALPRSFPASPRSPPRLTRPSFPGRPAAGLPAEGGRPSGVPSSEAPAAWLPTVARARSAAGPACGR